jgi:hypothetical protein
MFGFYETSLGLVRRRNLQPPMNKGMGDLELDLLLDLGRHVPMRFIHILCSPVEEIKIYDRTLRRMALIKRPGGRQLK